MDILACMWLLIGINTFIVNPSGLIVLNACVDCIYYVVMIHIICVNIYPAD